MEQVELSSDPARALTSYSRGLAGVNEVMRALTTHRGWFAPLALFTEEGVSPRVVDAILVLSAEARVTPGELWVFTGREAALRAQAAGAELGTYGGRMGGAELFGKVPPGTNVVRVNPGSPVEETWTFLSDGGIEAGMVWSEAVALEESFGRWEQGGRPDRAAFVNYQAFLTLDHPTGQVVTLPGALGLSNPAAAFTAPDCLEAFMARLSDEQRGGLRVVTIDGGALLSNAASLGVDGLAINLFGPGATYALRFDSLAAGS